MLQGDLHRGEKEHVHVAGGLAQRRKGNMCMLQGDLHRGKKVEESVLCCQAISKQHLSQHLYNPGAAGKDTPPRREDSGNVCVWGDDSMQCK